METVEANALACCYASDELFSHQIFVLFIYLSNNIKKHTHTSRINFKIALNCVWNIQ